MKLFAYIVTILVFDYGMCKMSWSPLKIRLPTAGSNTEKRLIAALPKVELRLYLPRPDDNCKFPECKRKVIPNLYPDMPDNDYINGEYIKEPFTIKSTYDTLTIPLTKCEEVLTTKGFNVNATTMIHVPGLRMGRASQVVRTIFQGFLERGDHNLILFNWKILKTSISTAFRNSKFLMKELAKCLDTLTEESNHSIKYHITSFSFGGPMSGILGSFMKHKPFRITGLDPTQIYFSWTGTSIDSLDSSDGDFVEIYHSDTRFIGVSKSTGTIDIYFNNCKHNQPGCDKFPPPILCNHRAAAFYFVEAITQDPKNPTLVARKCESWEKFNGGRCDRYESLVLGLDFDLSKYLGDYYLHAHAWNVLPRGKGMKGSLAPKVVKI